MLRRGTPTQQYCGVIFVGHVMTLWRPVPVLTMLLVAGPVMAQPVPFAPPMAPRMTSETPEYCAHLGGEYARALRNHPQASAESRMLAEEGSKMCARGHLRAGIMRLRRALKMVRSGG